MMKITGLIVGMLLLVGSVYAQADIQKLRPTVKAAAKKMNEALVKKNLAEFVKTTHPKVIEGTPGGAEKIVKDLEAQLSAIEKDGANIVSAWTGEASPIIDTAGEYQCTIPQYMKRNIKDPKGVLITQTTLMAISQDKGKTWYFVDATDKTLAQWKTVFPTLSSKLVIKPSPEPKFEPAK
jgi:hypothetical protein